MQTTSIEVLWIARYDYQANWKLKIHTHDYYQMICILGGKGEFYLGEKQYIIAKDRLFLIKPGCQHGLTTGENAVLKTLDIKFNLQDTELCRKLEELEEGELAFDDQLKSLMEKIRQEGIDKKPYYKEFSSTYLNQMLLILIRHAGYKTGSVLQSDLYCPADEKDPVTHQVLECIRQNYGKPLTLSQIAGFLGYNKNYVCDRFKKSMGYTPMKYLYLYRIMRAKELIKYSDYSLKEISEISGFESIHHFTRLFHQQEGLAPGQWREQEREGVRKDIFINENFKNTNYTSR